MAAAARGRATLSVSSSSNSKGPGLGAKLKLKRRRPAPPESVLPPPPPALPPQPGKGCCWFEEQDLNDAERTWITLLKTVDPHLSRSSLEKEIKLPTFLTKTSQAAEPRSHPETFHAGLKPFQWVPFPLYHRTSTAARDESFQNSENKITGLREKENVESGGSRFNLLPSDEESLTINIHTGTSERCHLEHSLKPENRGATNLYLYTKPQNSSPGTSLAASAQCCPQEFDFQKFGKGPIPQCDIENRKEEQENSPSDDALIQQSTLSTEATSVFCATKPSPASSAVKVQEKTAGHKEGLSALDRCPMCQIPFTGGTWSELDLDTHLAKCLSESVEDVTW